MPLTYRIFDEAQLLFIRGEGVVTQSQRLQTMKAWLADPAYPHCVDALCDFSMAQTTPRLEDLRQLIALMGDRLPDAGPRKLAIVVSKPITFGVGQVFGDLLRIEAIPLEVKVFFDRELAWAWLRPADAPLGPDR